MTEVTKNNTTNVEERIKLMKKSLTNFIDNFENLTIDFSIKLFDNFKTNEGFKRFLEIESEFVVRYRDTFLNMLRLLRKYKKHLLELKKKE